MDTHDFIARFGGIYEHSPWVAEQVAPMAASLDDVKQIGSLMADCVDNSTTERQLELIRAHPDLAGKAQLAGELTADSAAEQRNAGLDQCTPEELSNLQSLNAEYRDKFGFPFVMAVRGFDRAEIIDALSKRLKNDYDFEFETALIEIHKIARFRLDAMETTR